MTKKPEPSQDDRRASAKVVIDKIRRRLTAIDLNVSPVSLDTELAEAREECRAIAKDLGTLADLLSKLNA